MTAGTRPRRRKSMSLRSRETTSFRWTNLREFEDSVDNFHRRENKEGILLRNLEFPLIFLEPRRDRKRFEQIRNEIRSTNFDRIDIFQFIRLGVQTDFVESSHSVGWYCSKDFFVNQHIRFRCLTKVIVELITDRISNQWIVGLNTQQHSFNRTKRNRSTNQNSTDRKQRTQIISFATTKRIFQLELFLRS